MKKNLLITLLISVSASLLAQTTPKEKGLESITMDAIKGQLEFLSSDWTEGRATGEKGSYLAADYIASMFKVYGVAGGGDMAGNFGMRQRPDAASRPSVPARSHFQNFTLIETLPGGTSSMTIKKGGREYQFDEGVDFMLSRAAVNTSFESQAVFVGYGISDKVNGIDDFAGTDIKGKVVIRLSGYPGINDPSSAMYKKLIGDNPRAAFEIMRKKNEILSTLGAAGVIDIVFNQDITKRWGVYMYNNNMSPAENRWPGNYYSMDLDAKEISSTPINLSVTERVKNLIIKDLGIDIQKYENEAAAGTVKFKPVTIQGLSIVMKVMAKTRRVKVNNVIAVIEGENPNEIVAVGAHMDHMGMDNGKIWNGADDNASGTVGVMTLAKAFAASGVKPKRTVVFCAWTGEEKGLLGSEYFTLYPSVGKISDYKFYMNFDMIARDVATDTEKNKAGITYTKSYPKLEEITKQAKEQYKINLNLSITGQDEPRGGSDYTAFTANKVPVIAWMAAMHPDYHQPSDQINLINWNKMLDIIKLGYLQLWEAANGEIK